MSLKIFKFTVPFKQPFRVSGKSYHERSGLYFADKDNISEASPLFHITNNDIQKTIDYVAKHHFNTHTDDFFHLPAYIQWGLESQNIPYCNKSIFSNALLSEARHVNENVIKIKVNNQLPRVEHKLLVQIIEHNPNATLRLDANNGWSLEQSLFWFQELPTKVKDRIEYIEEPLQNISRIEDFYEFTQIPYALDQSLNIQNLEEYKHYKGLKKLILKPSSQNSPQEVREWAQNFPDRCIITSSLDTDVGINKLKGLVQQLKLENQVHGLNTLQLLNLDRLQREKVYEL